MKLSGNKKIVLLGIILLIIAGIVVVALKGVKVSLNMQQHEELNVYIGKPTKLNDIKAICQEVFENKRFVVKKYSKKINHFCLILLTYLRIKNSY